MLEEEGFTFDRYIDIFDGGPTVICPTDRIRTVRESVEETVVEIGNGGKLKCCCRPARSRITAPALAA
jgi:arginine N-succinyltransferase